MLAVIPRFDGYLAKYLGDGVLVYFGYPRAHEDDAARAVRAGLGLIAAMQTLRDSSIFGYPSSAGPHWHSHRGSRGGGDGERDIPRSAGHCGRDAQHCRPGARQAAPNTVVISSDDLSARHGFFSCEALGPQALKNVSVPMDCIGYTAKARRRVALRRRCKRA